MNAVIRAFVAAAMLIAAVAAYFAGQRTGNYWGVVIVLLASAAYWVLEIQASRGTTFFSFQKLLVRYLVAFVVVLLGGMLVFLGVSELSSPVTFNRPLLNTVAHIIRELAGAIGLAVLLGTTGVAVILKGVRLIPFIKGRVPHA